MKRKNGKEKLWKHIIVLLLIISILVAEIPIALLKTEHTARASELPFDFEPTSYGVQDSRIVANKLVITGKYAEMSDVVKYRDEYGNSVYGFAFINDWPDGGSEGTCYLVGVAGCTASYKITVDSPEPKASCVYSPYVYVDGINWKEEFSGAVYSIRDPGTGKYDLYNAATGFFDPCQMDSIGGIGRNGGILVQKDGLYGLADGNGKIIYEPLYDTIKFNNDDDYFIGKKGDSYAVLTLNGVSSGTDFYEEYSSSYRFYSGGEYRLLAVKKGQKWGVLSLDTGMLLSECKYSSVSLSDAGFAVGYLESGAEVILKDQVWNVCDKLEKGKYSSARITQDGKIFIQTTHQEELTGNIIIDFYGIVDCYGTEILDLTGKTVGQDCDYEYQESYRGLLLVRQAVRESEVRNCYLQSYEGEHILDGVHEDYSYGDYGVKVVGEYLLVTLEDGRSVLLDPRSGQIVLENISVEIVNNYVRTLGEIALVVRDASSENGKIGIFNLKTGQFSGFFLEGDVRGYTYGNHGVWKCSDGENSPVYINDTFEVLPFSGNSDIYDFCVLDKELNLLFKSKSGKLYITDYNGKQLIEFNGEIKEYYEYIPQIGRAHV